VARSYPTPALNPTEPASALLPTVMSWSADVPPSPYSAGLAKPRPALANCARAWFASARIAAHCGDPALVPPTRKMNVPSGVVWMTSTPPFSAALYETSGIARPGKPRPDWNEGGAKSELTAPAVARPNPGSFHV